VEYACYDNQRGGSEQVCIQLDLTWVMYSRFALNISALSESGACLLQQTEDRSTQVYLRPALGRDFLSLLLALAQLEVRLAALLSKGVLEAGGVLCIIVGLFLVGGGVRLAILRAKPNSSSRSPLRNRLNKMLNRSSRCRSLFDKVAEVSGELVLPGRTGGW